MKVALIHDWITGYRGGEKCLSAILELYPEADIFTLIHIPNTTTKEIDSRVKKTSFLQKLPNVQNYYRYLLPLFPFATKSFDLKSYDLVISLSHAVAKNVKVNKNTIHICYCFTPMRYIWDQAIFYFGKKTKILYPMLWILRIWDKRCAKNVTHFVAISNFIAARIRCYYGRKSSVIYPPVDTDWIVNNQSQKKDYYLWAGALVPYKRPELVVETCTKYKLPLKVSGSGPMLEKLKEISGETVEFLGKTSDVELAKAYHEAKALLFPAIEDFGMIPVECQAAGTPIIALDRGGSRETVVGYKSWSQKRENHQYTGVLIKRSEFLSQEILLKAINTLKEIDINPDDCIKHAKSFNKKRFKDELLAIINNYVSISN